VSIPAVSPGQSIAHRLVTRIALSPLGLRFLRDLGCRIDPTLLRLSAGRFSCVWPFPAILVTHMGAKSGITRTTALVYFTDKGRVVLMATNFGAQKNPAWYYNIKANPVVTLCGRRIMGDYVAEEVFGAERDRLFRRVTDAPGPYGTYREVAHANNRCVPVIALSPAEGGR
jgi:deazaflavin-dependent oxidoreductase (nitroreductase family)